MRMQQYSTRAGVVMRMPAPARGCFSPRQPGAAVPTRPVTAKIAPVKPPIRLLGVDIDGTLLNPEFQISAADMAALRRAHAEGVEVILVTGRRHAFAVPIAPQLGFDLWLIRSHGAITRS